MKNNRNLSNVPSGRLDPSHTRDAQADRIDRIDPIGPIDRNRQADQANRVIDRVMDETLSLLAQVRPPDGLERRLQLRLAQANSANALAAEHSRPWHPSPWHIAKLWQKPAPKALLGSGKPFFAAPRRLALPLIAATAAIAAGLFYNSHTNSDRHPGSPVPAPVPVMNPAAHGAPLRPIENGFGTGGAIRIAPHAASPSLQAHGRLATHRRHPREPLSVRHQPLPPGVAVPRTPAGVPLPPATEPATSRP